MSPEEKGEKEPVLKVVGALVMSCYAKYWIFVCGGMFIMVSFAGKLVGYKIVYMLMFLICLCLYQVGLVGGGHLYQRNICLWHYINNSVIKTQLGDWNEGLQTIAKVFGGSNLFLGKERDFRRPRIHKL